MYADSTYDSRNPPIGVVACWRRRGVMIEVVIALCSQSPAWRDENPHARLARMVVSPSHLRERKPPATCLRRPQAFAVAGSDGSVCRLPPPDGEGAAWAVDGTGRNVDEGGSETTRLTCAGGGATLTSLQEGRRLVAAFLRRVVAFATGRKSPIDLRMRWGAGNSSNHLDECLRVPVGGVIH